MRLPPLLPTRRLVAVLAALALAAAAARLAGIDAGPVARAGAGAALALALAVAVDALVALHRLRRHPLAVARTLPHAFAIGQPHEVALRVSNPGPRAWRVALHDHAPGSFATSGLPLALHLPAGAAVHAAYGVTPGRRGAAAFAPAALRVRTPAGLLDIALRVGVAESRQVYPNFAALARYAWLAGDRRLAEIGIKSYRTRGGGTDFRQLGEYSAGSPVRHVDWNATMRHGRPVVREFQDERDQAVVLMLDCGRRMRADERTGGAVPGRGPAGGSHFDHALDALMLLAYVALKDGDAVGALTFGTPPGEARHAPPGKGLAALNALVARLHDVEPSLATSDYLAAARELMRRQPRRALVVLLTNFRDEDGGELEAAVRLLRTRHLVLVASLRERRIGELMAGAVDTAEGAATVAAAHLLDQARRDAFRRLAGRDALRVDVEPEGLAAALVNRYHQVKRAGLL